MYVCKSEGEIECIVYMNRYLLFITVALQATLECKRVHWFSVAATVMRNREFYVLKNPQYNIDCVSNYENCLSTTKFKNSVFELLHKQICL